MTLVTEDGSGLSTAESYISVTAADTYHSNRGDTSWTGTDAAKEAALRLATEYLDGHYRGRWKGIAVTSSQALAWPREDVIDEDGYDVASDAVPTPVARACAECARRALSGDLVPDLSRGGAIKSVQAGSVGVVFESGANPSKTYPEIDQILSGLLVRANRLRPA